MDIKKFSDAYREHSSKHRDYFEIYDENVKGPHIINKLPDHKKLDSYKMIYLSPGINIRKIYSKGEFPKRTDMSLKKLKKVLKR